MVQEAASCTVLDLVLILSDEVVVPPVRIKLLHMVIDYRIYLAGKALQPCAASSFSPKRLLSNCRRILQQQDGFI